MQKPGSYPRNRSPRVRPKVSGDEVDWTPEAVAKLTRLWMQTDPQLSTNEIGRQMRCGKNAVVGKCGRLGLPSRPSPIKRSGNGADAPTPGVRHVPTLAELVPLPSLGQTPARDAANGDV